MATGQTTTVIEDARATREAARQLGTTPADVRDSVLRDFADRIDAGVDAIVAANGDDMESGRADGLTDALLDRLRLDPERVAAMASGVRSVTALPDPLGEVLEDRVLDNGLHLRKLRVPFGVICVVYEARPNVTADAAAIALKTGNGAILRGSTQAQASNAAIVALLHEALDAHGLPVSAVAAFDPTDRDGFRELIAAEGAIDLVIPRGGEGLKRYLMEHARVPVLAAAGGNCHVYVDESADRDLARDIVLNAKTSRPGVCNAAETLLVHSSRAADLVPYLIAHLNNAGVEVIEGEEAFATEFLDLKIALGLVDSVEDAVAHINRYGTGHSEAIVTEDAASARLFTDRVDAAVVYVNASTRFTDGGEFGMGAEVGISTSKLHARGPIGLRELTTTKYVVEGDGQIRA